MEVMEAWQRLRCRRAAPGNGDRAAEGLMSAVFRPRPLRQRLALAPDDRGLGGPAPGSDRAARLRRRAFLERPHPESYTVDLVAPSDLGNQPASRNGRRAKPAPPAGRSGGTPPIVEKVAPARASGPGCSFRPRRRSRLPPPPAPPQPKPPEPEAAAPKPEVVFQTGAVAPPEAWVRSRSRSRRPSQRVARRSPSRNRRPRRRGRAEGREPPPRRSPRRRLAAQAKSEQPKPVIGRLISRSATPHRRGRRPEGEAGRNRRHRRQHRQAASRPPRESGRRRSALRTAGTGGGPTGGRVSGKGGIVKGVEYIRTKQMERASRAAWAWAGATVR
jgi:hypothetical protein